MRRRAGLHWAAGRDDKNTEFSTPLRARAQLDVVRGLRGQLGTYVVVLDRLRARAR